MPTAQYLDAFTPSNFPAASGTSPTLLPVGAMAGKKRTVASERSQRKLPQGKTLANAGGINSLSSSSVQPHQSPYSMYSPAPTLAIGAPVTSTSRPSTASSPSSLTHKLPGHHHPQQLFQEQAQALAHSQVPHPGPGHGPGAGAGAGAGDPEVS